MPGSFLCAWGRMAISVQNGFEAGELASINYLIRPPTQPCNLLLEAVKMVQDTLRQTTPGWTVIAPLRHVAILMCASCTYNLVRVCQG